MIIIISSSSKSSRINVGEILVGIAGRVESRRKQCVCRRVQE